MICKDCKKEFTLKNSRQSRCKDCQLKYNKFRRNELTKALNRIENDIEIKPLRDGYIYLREWAEKQGHTLSGAQTLISRYPSQFNAQKVSNPHGGADVWAISEDSKWYKKSRVVSCVKPRRESSKRKVIQKCTIEPSEVKMKVIKKCTIEGCEELYLCKGLCYNHYMQSKKYWRRYKRKRNKKPPRIAP